jgi:C4-dicarboxylate-specific signal transduction histidine kinase
MTDHIYGRTNIITNPDRPHMFVAELYLYIDYLREQLEASGTGNLLPDKQKKQLALFYANLRQGMEYYYSIPELAGDARFKRALELAGWELDVMNYQYRLC